MYYNKFSFDMAESYWLLVYKKAARAIVRIKLTHPIKVLLVQF